MGDEALELYKSNLSRYDNWSTAERSRMKAHTVDALAKQYTGSTRADLDESVTQIGAIIDYQRTHTVTDEQIRRFQTTGSFEMDSRALTADQMYETPEEIASRKKEYYLTHHGTWSNTIEAQIAQMENADPEWDHDPVQFELHAKYADWVSGKGLPEGSDADFERQVWDQHLLSVVNQAEWAQKADYKAAYDKQVADAESQWNGLDFVSPIYLFSHHTAAGKSMKANTWDKLSWGQFSSPVMLAASATPLGKTNAYHGVDSAYKYAWEKDLVGDNDFVYKKILAPALAPAGMVMNYGMTLGRDTSWEGAMNTVDQMMLPHSAVDFGSYLVGEGLSVGYKAGSTMEKTALGSTRMFGAADLEGADHLGSYGRTRATKSAELFGADHSTTPLEGTLPGAKLKERLVKPLEGVGKGQRALQHAGLGQMIGFSKHDALFGDKGEHFGFSEETHYTDEETDLLKRYMDAGGWRFDEHWEETLQSAAVTAQQVAKAAPVHQQDGPTSSTS